MIISNHCKFTIELLAMESHRHKTTTGYVVNAMHLHMTMKIEMCYMKCCSTQLTPITVKTGTIFKLVTVATSVPKTGEVTI